MSLLQTMGVKNELAQITKAVRDIARENNRSNLVNKLDGATARLADTGVEVVVVGQFKQGKSALINAIVQAPVCPVDDLIATSVPTVVRWGEQPSAALITELKEEGRTLRTQIDPRLLRQHVTELAQEAGLLGSLSAEVLLPRKILADGLTLVDTPGSGRAQTRAFTNLTLLPQADAAIMVTDATQELTQPELTFLKQALALCPRVTCVVSKIDLQHQWRDIVQTNAQHLKRADIEIPILPTSALLRELADQEKDDSLRQESRIDNLVKHLQERVTSQVLSSRHREVADDIRVVGEHLAMALKAELQALGGTQQAVQSIQTLEQAQQTANDLARRSSRWQQTLGDGVGELISDLEFDLRDRLRNVGREAEQIIDSSDPGETWDDIGTWIAESITQAVSDNFVWGHERSIHLATVVAEHFALDGQTTIPELTLTEADQALGTIGGLAHVRSGHLSIGQKVIIGLKGSYGGVLMFGLMTTLAGMALVNPISVAAGLIMGGFAYRQDSSQRLEQRRSEAKMAVRKLIDEAIFQISKESRDRMNRVKRTLRDHFIGVAEELKHSLNESVQKAKNGADTPADQRSQRSLEVANQLQRVTSLYERALELVQPPTIPANEWSLP